MFKTIIFDFNGLIIDDEPLHCECFQRVLMDEEIKLTETDYWNIYLGFDDKGLFEAIFLRDGKSITPKKLKDLITKKNTLYLQLIKTKIKLFPGAVDFIRNVEQKFPLAIVSGALRSEIEAVLNNADLTTAFEFIVSADDTKKGKPDPEGFVIALSKLKKKHPEIRPENCLVLEDSLAGIIAAKRAGMKCVALTHSYQKEELKQADWIVDTFTEVEKLL